MRVVFFTDRDLGRRFPDILEAAGIAVERHRDHFADTAPDEEWIRAVAARGWIAISHDKAISRRPNERDAVMSAGLGLLIIVGAAPYAELAENFVRTMPRIAAFLRKHRAPFIAKVRLAAGARASLKGWCSADRASSGRMRPSPLAVRRRTRRGRAKRRHGAFCVTSSLGA